MPISRLVGGWRYPRLIKKRERERERTFFFFPADEINMQGEAACEKNTCGSDKSMRKHKANHRWQRVNRGRRAEPSAGSGIKRRDPALGARRSPVYRLEIKVASSPVLHLPLPHSPLTTSPSSSSPPPPCYLPGSRRCWQVMARK